MSDKKLPPKPLMKRKPVVDVQVDPQVDPPVDQKIVKKTMVRKAPGEMKTKPPVVAAKMPAETFAGTITLTFGDQAENHVNMEKIGKPAARGFTCEELKEAKAKFESKGYTCELIDLNEALSGTEVKGDTAALLVVRRGLLCVLDDAEGGAKLLCEQRALQWDSKALMYGRVVNKKARRNLCYADFAQEPDYAAGKGRVYNFADLPQTQAVRKELKNYLGDLATDLPCEGNFYYDVTKCGINYHSDLERKIVVACRLGASMPLHFQWHLWSKPIGERITRMLNHGDVYIMSEKAVGFDGRKKKIPILRHSAGFKEFVGYGPEAQ